MNRFDLRVAVLAIGAPVTLIALGACGGAASAVAPAQPPSGAADDASTASPEAALCARWRARSSASRCRRRAPSAPASASR